MRHSLLLRILSAVGKTIFRGWSGIRSWKSGGQTNLGALHWASLKVSTSEQKRQLHVADGEAEAQRNGAMCLGPYGQLIQNQGCPCIYLLSLSKQRLTRARGEAIERA